MLVPVAVALLLVIFWLAYRSLIPLLAKIRGSADGTLVESPRARLSNGRYVADREAGVPREEAKHKIIVIQGCNSKDMNLPIDRELIEELKLYVLYYDRPARSVRDDA